jgi:hypothetical protein
MDIAVPDQVKIAVIYTPGQIISNITKNNEHSPIRSPEVNRIGIFCVLHVSLPWFAKRIAFLGAINQSIGFSDEENRTASKSVIRQPPTGEVGGRLTYEGKSQHSRRHRTNWKSQHSGCNTTWKSLRISCT